MASKHLKIFPIPVSFQEIWHDFAKEVLRFQPVDIIDFGHEYFKAFDEGLEFQYLGEVKNKELQAQSDLQKASKAVAQSQAREEAPAAPAEAEERPDLKINPEPANETSQLVEDSKISSTKSQDKHAEKYVNDVIEKVSQEDEAEAEEPKPRDISRLLPPDGPIDYGEVTDDIVHPDYLMF